ncbi:unnamed protein product [Schistosoma turkestanicum]|nr:unnamed protein product [Schistosoma turkestanicum]
MPGTEFKLKSSDEMHYSQYHQLLSVETKVPEDSNSQELSLLSDKTDIASNHVDNNNNDNHRKIILQNSYLKIILLILIVLCVIFPVIYFLCYTFIHCNTNNLLNTTDTYHNQDSIFSSDSMQYLSSEVNSVSNIHHHDSNSNSNSHFSHSLNTLNKNKTNSIEQNNANLNFGIFDEPNEEEYERVVNFLKLKFNNSLYAFSKFTTDKLFQSKTWSEQLKMNLLWSLNLHIPKKQERLKYFNVSYRNEENSSELERYGIVIILFGSLKIPKIKEYYIGPLKKPKILKLLNAYPFYKRPLTNIEYNALLDYLTIQTHRIDHIIQDAYSASYFMHKPLNNYWLYRHNQSWFDQFNTTKSLCQKLISKSNRDIIGRPNCLIPMFASPLVTSEAPERRRVWMRLCREVTPHIQYPVDIQFHIDQTSLEPDEWYLLNIWFQGQMFTSLEELISKYSSGEFKVIRHQFIDMYPNQLKPGPSQQSTPHISESMKSNSETNNHKNNVIRINNRRIQYDKWDFYLTLRKDTGLRVFNVYFANISLISEAGLDETVTSYWGKSPFMQAMTSLESMYGIGGMTSELSPGLDCPENAIYLPVTLINSGETGPKLIKNAICLYEWKTNAYGGPVRRHFEFHINEHLGKKDGAKYTNFGFGITSYSLVVRTISTLFNYDYIFDIIFYSSGTMEFSVTPTGYIHVDEDLNPFHQSNSKYGFPATINPIYMVAHHHLFHFKIDVDIVNRENFFKVVKINGPLTENQMIKTGNFQPVNNQSKHKLTNSELLWLSIDIPKTEMEARFSTKFEFPKQYLICSMDSNMKKSDKINEYYYENDKCLIIVNKGQIKTIFNDEHTKSFAWSRHQLYVTQQHDNESFASSIFNGIDLNSPVVDFTKFSSNNESIFNEDLVLWLTVGNYHLPRNEDLPNTATSGGPLSIFIMPHNLFTYSPDAFACNRFYTDSLNEWIRGPQMKEECPMESIPML